MSSTARADLGRPGGASVASLIHERAWALTVWAGMLVWTLALYAIVRDAYSTFRIGRFDLGHMVQAVWSTSEGRFLDSTHGATGEQVSRLASHVDPFLALLAPVWLLWPSPLALALAQIVVVALGALPIFWLARHRTGSDRVAGLLGLGYLAYPWVATSAAGAIHPVTFAVTFLLFCVWFLETDRLVPFVVFALLAMSTGELMGLPVAALGIWFAVARGRRRAGAAIAVLGAAWTALAIYVIVPTAAGEGSIYYGFYDQVGGSPQGVLRKLVSDPLVVLRALVEGHDIAYLLLLGFPLLFLFVLSPGLALVALPQLLANGLSDFRSMTDPRYHSVAAVIPFLIAATVLGIARLGPQRRSAVALAVLVCSTIVAVAVAPWGRALGYVPLGSMEKLPSERVAALSAAVALVPDAAPVTSSNVVGAHLSARRYVYSVPLLERATWVVVDRADPWVTSADSPLLTNHPEVVSAFVSKLVDDPAWERVYERAGVVVFHRTAPG